MTFTTPTWYSPVGGKVHEIELCKKYLPTWKRLAAVAYLLPLEDQAYIREQGFKFAETGMVGNPTRFYEYAKDRLEFIAKMQAKCKGVSL